MNKNTIMAVVCSGIVLIAYTIVQVKFFPPVPAENQNVEQIEETPVSAPSENPVSVDTGSIVEAGPDNEIVEEKTYTISTDKVRVTFTNRGGDVISYEILDHFDSRTGKSVEMADNITSRNRAFSLAFGGADKPAVNDLFIVKEFPASADGEKKIAFAKKYSDFTLVKQYTFRPDEYMFRLNVIVEGKDSFTGLNSNDSNGLNTSYTLRTSPQIGPYFDVKIDRYESRSFLSAHDNKGKKVRLSTKQFKEFNKAFDWAGIGGKYFCEIIIPLKPDTAQTAYYSTNIEVGDYANAQAFIERKGINDRVVNDVYDIYVGPRSEKELKKYLQAENNKWGLSDYRLTEALESSGFLGWLEAILKWFMEMIYRLVPNWGVSIIILTVILKIALFPLTMKSSLGTLKMQEIQPKMQAIQAKYKENPQKMQEETAKLYKEAGYNPMSGCLPMIFQMLFLFAMYNLFNNYFEFRGAGFVKGWIDDLSSGDSIYVLKTTLPFIGNHIRILPVIYLASQLFYGKITQLGSSMSAGQNAGTMKFMTYGMPIMFFFMFYNAPSGLILFWTVSNIIQMGQQLIINKTMKNHKEGLKPVVAKNPKAKK